MRKCFIVTMWSGGIPCKKWRTLDRPKTLPQGTGVEFTCLETKLAVQIIGSVSVEEYEHGREAFEKAPSLESDLDLPNI